MSTAAELNSREAIKYWHEPVMGGIDLLKAQCVGHRFARHAHTEFVLAIIEQGAERFETEGRCVTAPAGSVLMIPPSVAHTGQAANTDGWSYRAFYPPVNLMHEIATDTFRDKCRPESMSVQLYQDARLFGQLARAHRCFTPGQSSLDQAVELVAALRMLLVLVHPKSDFNRSGREYKKVAIVRDYINAHYDDQIDGVEIAGVVGLSVPHTMRIFSAHMGVPMNVYLNTVRLARARQLLRDGRDAANVAVDVGFTDQSHLIRRFRDAFGVTPGQYVRDSGTHGQPNLIP